MVRTNLWHFIVTNLSLSRHVNFRELLKSRCCKYSLNISQDRISLRRCYLNFQIRIIIKKIYQFIIHLKAIIHAHQADLQVIFWFK